MTGNHMALFLVLQMQRSDGGPGRWKYSMYGMPSFEWKTENEQLEKDWRCRDLLSPRRRSPVVLDPEMVYGRPASPPWCLSRDKFPRQEASKRRRTSDDFMQRNKTQGNMREFAKLLRENRSKECEELQRGIPRDKWEDFSGAFRVGDFSAPFQPSRG